MAELVKQRLYEYAVIWHPTKEQAKTQKSKLVVNLTRILATDEKSVGMLAVKAIPVEYDDQLDQIEIAVKVF